MTNLNALPAEIRQLILQHIDSRKQLGECRRISKIWDEPAECAMFSRPLHITKNNVKPLFDRLSKKKSRANCIKEINLVDCRLNTKGIDVLLRWTITPSIEKITSQIYDLDQSFYQKLTHMVRDSGIKLDRLKSISWPNRFTDTHHQTALALKDSLQEIAIPNTDNHRPHKIAEHLGDFKQLSKIQVVGCVFDNLDQVETVFGGVDHLMDIELRGCRLDEANIWPQEQRLQWMNQHNKNNENPITLAVDDDGNRSFPLIEYFLFKFPNARQFDYHARGLDFPFEEEEGEEEEVDYNTEISKQACLWISKIPKYTMTLNVQHQWRAHYDIFAGNKNVLWLNYGESTVKPKYEEASVSSILEQDGERSTQFQFSFNNNVYQRNFFNAHVPFLQHIGTFTTGMHMHFGNSNQLQAEHFRTLESKVFFKTLECMNRLEDFSFTSSGSMKSVKLHLPRQYNKRPFNALEISGAELQPKVFHTLDRLFSTINTLKLSCCPIQEDKKCTICIHMPTTALGKLIMDAEGELIFSQDAYDYEGENELQDMVFLEDDTYLMIALQQRVTLYFKLEPSSSDVQQVSKAEYSKRPRHATAFQIDCQKLESIELDLGEIHATIDVQKYIEELGVAFN